MQVPKWFYIVIAAAAVIFAAGSALHNISTIGAERFSYYAATARNTAVVFDRRTGTSCRFVGGVFLCADYPGHRIEQWDATVGAWQAANATDDAEFEQWKRSRATAPAQMDTGMTMDSTRAP